MIKLKSITPLIFGSPVTHPKVSVIVVTYKLGDRLTDCLDALIKQDYQNFEIILINNGEINIDIVKKYNIRYVDLGRNYGCSYARNVGASVAKAPILAFLDDDAIPERRWVSAIRQSLESKNIVGVRGKVVPQHTNLFNLLPRHYNLGNSIKQSYIDFEGSCGFKRKEYLAVGGFNPKIAYGEGIDLTYRLSKFTNAITIYDPSIVVAHDYADSLRHYIKKCFRNGKNNKKQEKMHKDFLGFMDKYKTRIDTGKLNIVLRILRFPLYIIGEIASKLGACLVLVEN
jgi:GT2 family glycosyltransferase